MFGEEENTPFDQNTTLERYKAEVLADQEKHDADPAEEGRCHIANRIS